MKTRFNWKDFIKKVAAIAVPVALQNLLTTTGSMVDTMMIAPLGETSVGAVGLCAQFSSLMFSCYWGFVGGGMLFLRNTGATRTATASTGLYGMTFGIHVGCGNYVHDINTCFPHLIMQLYTDKVNSGNRHKVPARGGLCLSAPDTRNGNERAFALHRARHAYRFTARSRAGHQHTAQLPADIRPSGLPGRWATACAARRALTYSSL